MQPVATGCVGVGVGVGVKCSSPTSSVNFNNNLAASVFVNQTASDICNYFKDHMSEWQVEYLKDIVLPGDFILVHYVDDLLLASKT